MELDELKSYLNERMERAHREKSAGDIALLLGKKTQSVAGKLKRSLTFELIASIMFTIGCTAVAIFTGYTSLRIYFAIFAILCFLFIPLLLILQQKVTKLTASALPVKSNLQQLVNLLKEYIKRYFQLTIALIPISIIISFLLGYNDENLYDPSLQNPFFPASSGSSLKVIFVALYLLAFTAGMYYFTKWYLKRLYGNYIEQLQQLIIELGESE